MLRCQNKKIWEIIIKEFDNNNSIGHIAYKYNVKRSAVENAWLKQFGIKKVEQREKKLFGTPICCPVCGKKGNKSFILRHLMNSRKEEKHAIFIEKQDLKIKEIYRNLPDEDLDPYKISYRDDLYCSASYIRKIFSEFDDYKLRFKNKRSMDIKQQYDDGRRERPIEFCNGWKLTRENGGKRFISAEKYNEIISLYNSGLTQKDTAKKVGCKEETLHKYWVERFGKENTSKRNRAARIEKITKIDKEQEKQLKTLFYEEKTVNEISKETDIDAQYIGYFFRKTFSGKEREERFERMLPYIIKKSLVNTGKAGITGSYPEQLCYEMLQTELKHNVMHHDFDLIPPYEIDITIPELKIAISWDGPFHRKNIFGNKTLEKVIKRDKKKIFKLNKIGWKIIVVEDNKSNHTEKTVMKAVNEIINIIHKDFILERVEI
jgi:transposase-like protein/very-short-patch-repair endonuclease